jgi:hypothetical protein
MPTYCGNNLNYSGLLAGTHVLGTNYQCMRKGIGVGSHLPYDSAYAGAYAPVDPRRFYCGNAAVPPAAGGYLAVGSPSKCLQVGVGVGKVKRAAMGPPFGMYFIRYVLPYLLFFIITGGIFSILYFTKPKFVTKTDPKDPNKDIIDWSKFVPYFIVACLVVSIIIWWFWRRFVRRWI